jgi:hypothetical protein
LFAAPNTERRIEADGRETVVIDGTQWETLGAVEHGVVELGGAVELEWDDERPVAIRNGLPHAIEDLELTFDGGKWDVGTVEPNQRVELASVDERELPSLSGRITPPIQQEDLLLGDEREANTQPNETEPAEQPLEPLSIDEFEANTQTNEIMRPPWSWSINNAGVLAGEEAVAVGRLERGCADRGSFQGQRCETVLIVRGRP